jgi:oligosaccharide repeat unit polymerase
MDMYYRHLKAHQIIIGFYLVFISLALMGNILIPYPSISLTTWLMWLCYVLSISVGTFFGGAIKLPVIKGYVSPKVVLASCVIIVSLSIVYSWWLILVKYGAISYIIANAYQIRMNNIGGVGEEFIPIYISWAGGLVYGAFALTLAYIGRSKNPRLKLLAIFLFALIFLNDVQVFGRIGMLYGIFCICGFILIFKVRKILTLRNLMICLLIFFVVVSPRIIRRGGAGLPFVGDSKSDSLPYVKYNIPVAFNEFVDAYAFYFTSFYALDEYVINQHSQYTLGLRTFTPVLRIINRISGDQYISTLDKGSNNTPYEGFNVYTVIRDFYGDFGVAWVIIFPFIIGLYFGTLFRFKGVIYDAQKIYLLGWLFYTPIYNAFSFGTFFISFIFLIGCTLICKKDILQMSHKKECVPIQF